MTHSSHMTRPQLELLYLGVASDEVARHTEICEACRTAVSRLESERAAFLRRHPPAALVRGLQVERARRRRRQEIAQRLVGSLALAAALTALVIRGAWTDAVRGRPDVAGEAAEPADTLRPKGGSRLGIVVKRGDAIRVVEERATLQPGDELRIRFTLQAAGPVAAGVLTDAGDWLPLFEGGFRAGSHTPAATLRVTESPEGGVVLLGRPEDVDAARAGAAAAVQRARLDWVPAAEHPNEDGEGVPVSGMAPSGSPVRPGAMP